MNRRGLGLARPLIGTTYGCGGEKKMCNGSALAQNRQSILKNARHAVIERQGDAAMDIGAKQMAERHHRNFPVCQAIKEI